MKTKPKDMGTRYETARVKYHNAWGIKARRKPLAGTKDTNDLWLVDPANDIGWHEECKARANLNQHQVLADAIGKTGLRTVLSHKRLVRVGDSTRRKAVGMAEIVCLHPDAFERLLVTHEELRERDPNFVRDLWNATPRPQYEGSSEGTDDE